MEELLDKKELLMAVGGAVAGWIVSLVTGLGKVKNDLSFIKGQLSQLIKIHEDVDSLKEKHAILSRDHAKTKKDVDAAHGALRDLKGVSTHERLT